MIRASLSDQPSGDPSEAVTLSPLARAVMEKHEALAVGENLTYALTLDRPDYLPMQPAGLPLPPLP